LWNDGRFTWTRKLIVLGARNYAKKKEKLETWKTAHCRARKKFAFRKNLTEADVIQLCCALPTLGHAVTWKEREVVGS